MQIHANLHSTGFPVGLVGIFHKEAAILSLLYFVLVSGRHNPFSKAWEFIIRCIRALMKGDGQRVAVSPALLPPRPQRHLRDQAVRAGRTQNMSQAGNKTISTALVAAIALQAGQSRCWEEVWARGCTAGISPLASLLRASLWQNWDEKPLVRAGASAVAVRHLVFSELVISRVKK